MTVDRAAAASTDATLSDLVVNDGTTDLTLTPTFASGMYTYTASVVNAVAQVTVTPTKNDSGATIEYLDASDMTLDDAGTDAGHQVAVAVGDTVIKVKVTAQDGNATQTYTVTVKRAAAANADATLSNLVVNDGTTDLDAEPGFRIGHHHLHGDGGEHRRRGDGDRRRRTIPARRLNIWTGTTRRSPTPTPLIPATRWRWWRATTSSR